MSADGHWPSGSRSSAPPNRSEAPADHTRPGAEYPEAGEPGRGWPVVEENAGIAADESPIQVRRELRRRVGNPRAAARYVPPAPANPVSPGLPGLGPPSAAPTGTGSRASSPAGSGSPSTATGRRPPASAAPTSAAPTSAAPTSAAPSSPPRTGPLPTTPGTRSASGAPTDPGPGTSGRHARREPTPRPARLDYIPRHASHGAGPVSATDVTEVLARVRQDPTERPMPARPEPEPISPPPRKPREEQPAAEQERGEDPAASGKRVRVVLSQRKGQARPVRTVVDVQELTQVGEVLSTSLIRSQLALTLRIGGIALLVLGSLPAMFVIFPMLGRFELFGIRLPWLLLGVLAYPFLLALGWMYARSAERLEQVFADHIQS